MVVTGARVVDRTATPPLWTQVHDDLRRRLAAGEFTDTFPGEHALAAAYRVSRHTIREALRRLRDGGLVVAARGRPPRLAAPVEIHQPIGALYSFFAAVEATGQRQHSIVRILDIRADGVVATRLGLEESTPLLHLERLRLADSVPLAVDRVWLPATLATPLLQADFRHTALYDELAARCGIRLTGGEERIRAVVPTRAEQALLGIGPGVAAFTIDRLAHHHDVPAEWRRTLVRGDRFVVTAAFSGRAGYRLDVAGDLPRPRRQRPTPKGPPDP